MRIDTPRAGVKAGLEGPQRSVRRRRPGMALLLGSLALVAVTFSASLAQADQNLPVVRVEEDWELEIGVPDPETNAPQVTCVMSPTGSLSGEHAVFELNHQDLGDYAPGGVQLQGWRHEDALLYRNSPSTNDFAVEGEQVSFTMSMELSGGNLHVEVLNGQSVTWGTFGGQGYLKFSLPCGLYSLDGYSPDFSAAHSKIGFASHRVKRLVLKRARFVLSNGAVITDSVGRVVHLHNAVN